MNILLSRLNPAVPRNSLIFMAGIVWLLVGVLLISLAVGWLARISNLQVLFFAVPGLLLGMMVHKFGFSKIVTQNLERLLKLNGKICLFAFIPWKSYLIIFIMINLGIFLRHSVLPKPYLSIIYIGIGLAMVLSSVEYFRTFSREIR